MTVPSEKTVVKAIDHILDTMDRRGWEKLTVQSKKAYNTLYHLREGLTGSMEDGTAVVFYTP